MEEIPKRVMVSVAHPDDAEFGAAGTVAKWTRAGSEVLYLICTSGNKGTSDRTLSPEKLARTREEEQRGAAKVLGVNEVVFLGYPDGGLEDTPELRGKIVWHIRRFKPDAVITFDFYRKSHNHRDHRMAGQVTMDAVYPYARDHLHYPEQLIEGVEPFKVGEVYLTGSDEPDVFVDISETLEAKVAALRCHASQLGERSRDIMEFVKENAKRAGEKGGVPYAEAFRRIQMRR